MSELIGKNPRCRSFEKGKHKSISFLVNEESRSFATDSSPFRSIHGFSWNSNAHPLSTPFSVFPRPRRT